MHNSLKASVFDAMEAAIGSRKITKLSRKAPSLQGGDVRRSTNLASLDTVCTV